MNQRTATQLAHAFVAETVQAELVDRCDDHALMYGLDEADTSRLYKALERLLARHQRACGYRSPDSVCEGS